jgi:hypothetical protein
MFQPRLRLAFLVAASCSGLAIAQEDAPRPVSAPLGVVLQDTDQPKSLAVWFGHVASDNLVRTEAGQEGSYDNTLGLLLAMGHTSTRVAARVNADLARRKYSIDSLEDETVGTLSANAAIGIVRDHFAWAFSDYFGQGITDPFRGVGPGNRETVNVAGTGPRIAVPLGSRGSMDIRSTYSERRFEDSPDVDSNSLFTELGLFRQTSPTARVGVVASANDVEYEDTVSPQYEIDRVGLRYQKELATGRVVADLGTNEVSFGGVDDDEPFFSLVWTRALTPRSDLSFRATREFTDSPGVLGTSLAPGLEGSAFTDVIVSANPLEQERFGASYALTLSRTVVSAELGLWKDKYVGDTSFNNDWTATRLSVVRTVSPNLNLGGSVVASVSRAAIQPVVRRLEIRPRRAPILRRAPLRAQVRVQPDGQRRGRDAIGLAVGITPRRATAR